MSQRKVRRSRQRDRILNVLQATDHPTASEVYDRLKPEFPSLSLGNVYRNLNILVEQDLVDRIQAGSTFDRFEARKSPHFHFVCTNCGKIIDVDPPETIHSTLNELATSQLGIVPDGHRVEYYGRCSDCP
jgi:Fur family peroxide stress response transcriptional regulator